MTCNVAVCSSPLSQAAAGYEFLDALAVNLKPKVTAFCDSLAMKVGIECADIYCVLLHGNM